MHNNTWCALTCLRELFKYTVMITAALRRDAGGCGCHGDDDDDDDVRSLILPPPYTPPLIARGLIRIPPLLPGVFRSVRVMMGK